MAAGVWVTAGAPLEDGDGWRVWYSWPAGDFTPELPRVRTAAGVNMTVTPGAWAPAPAPKGSSRQMGVREIRVRGATPGELYEVTVPEHGERLYWRTLPAAIPETGSVSLLIGSCFWINDDRDGHYSSAVRELVQRERPMFKVLMGDQLYVDVWSPGTKNIRKGLAEKYERYWGDAAYRELLVSCPTVVSCDDHEFWNDFPEKQIHVPLSWDDHVQGELGRARRALRRLPERAQPRRQALVLVRHRPGLVLRRRLALASHAAGRPERGADARRPVASAQAVGARAEGPRRARPPAAAAEGGRQPDRPHAGGLQGLRAAGRGVRGSARRRRPATASRTTS